MTIHHGILYGDKINQMLILAMIQKNLKTIIPSESSQSQKTTYCRILFYSMKSSEHANL